MIFDRNETKEVIALLGAGSSRHYLESAQGTDQYDQPGRDRHPAGL